MTFIGYPDITATSESGRFRIEIRGTAGDHFFRDQSHFVYRLFDSDRVVWEWSPRTADDDCDALDDSPHEAWVSDRGWTVVRAHGPFNAGLIAISPDGQVVLRSIHRRWSEESPPGFLDDEPEQFMSDTSAGPFWSCRSIAYFSEYDERMLWTIRTWWGRRVVIDLEKHTFIDAAEFDLLNFEESERSLIQRTLAENIDRLEALADQPKTDDNDDEFWSVGSDVLAAAYHAGWLGAIRSIPYLRRLELLKSAGSYWNSSWAWIHELPFRRVAKISLLRLEQKPAWYPSYRFELKTETSGDDEIRNKVWFDVADRTEVWTAESLAIGLTEQETLRRIGTPDFIGRDLWEYDFFSLDESFTVRIRWENDMQDRSSSSQSSKDDVPCISRVERIEAQWKGITRRDRSLITW